MRATSLKQLKKDLKNMKKLLYIGIFFSIFLCSCQEDDVDIFPVTTVTDTAEDFEVLALNARNTNLVLVKTTMGETANLGAEVYAGSAVKSSDINYTYEIVGSNPSDVAGKLQAQLSGSIPSGSLISMLPITVNLDDFEVAAPQQVTLKLNSSDLSVTDMDEVTFSFTVVCPSDLAGTYTSTTTGQSTDGCCPNETTLTNTVTVTGADGAYTVSDFSAGLYLEWYSVYGVTPDTNVSGSISDVCGEVSGSFGEPFGSTINLTGSVDSGTGVITYTWMNGFGDTGTVILTPM